MPRLFLCEPFYPSFWADLLIGSLGAFIGIYGAYLIYRISVRGVLNDRLKYCASLIEVIVPAVLKQAENCNKHVEALVKDPFSNDYLNLVATRDHKRLADKVNQEDFFHAFLWKYKRTNETYKTFRNLYSRIDYLDSVWDDLLKTNEKIILGIWERKKQYAITFQKVKETIQSISMAEELVKDQPDLIKFSAGILQDFAANPTHGENVVDSYNIVVDPLYKFIIAHGKTHPKVTELMFLLTELYNHYTGIELSARHNATDYKWYGKALKEKADELHKLSEQLRTDFPIE